MGNVLKDRLVCGVYRPGIVVADDHRNNLEEAKQIESFARLVRAGNGDFEIVHDIQSKKYAKNLWCVA